MLAIIRLLPLVAAALAISSVHADNEHHDLQKREIEARNRFLDSMTPAVRDDMIKRGLDNIELDLTEWMKRDDESPYAEENLAKRGVGQPKTPGVFNCVDGHFSMTYDDGPYTWNRHLTDLYSSKGFHTTFFVNVNNWNCAYDYPNPENLQYALSKRMSIASHTATHPHMLTLDKSQWDQQIDIVNEYLWKAVGIMPNYIRMPYGETSQELNDHVWKKYRMHVIQWSTDSGDADNAAPEESIRRIKHAIDGEREIVLNHETHSTSVHQVAKAAVDYLAAKGKKSSGLKRCLNSQQLYKARRAAEARNPSWTCNGMPKPASR